MKKIADTPLSLDHPDENSLRLEELTQKISDPETGYAEIDSFIIDFCDQTFTRDATPNLKLDEFLQYIKDPSLDPRLKFRLNKLLSEKYFRVKAETFLEVIEKPPGANGWPCPAEVNYAEMAIKRAQDFGTEIDDLQMRFKALNIPHKPATITPEEFKDWQNKQSQVMPQVFKVLNREAA